MQNDNYKTLPLFSDIEDKDLQSRNRAVIMANVSEQYTKKGKITAKGASLVLGYFNCVPLEDRKEVEENYRNAMKERGYAT